MSTRNQVLIGTSMLVLLLCTAALYWQGLQGPFLLDDWHNIVSHYVGSPDWDEIVYVASHNTSGLLGRQVSMLSLLFSGIAHGPEPWGYKYHNLLLHLLNGLLVFWLLLKLLPRLADRLSTEQVHLVAGLVAATWLLHPLMVSTVLYAVQRMAQLSATFTLAALLCYVVLRERIGQGGLRFPLLSVVLLPTCILLAILSKENGALIPLYLFTIEFLVYGFAVTTRYERLRLLAVQFAFVFLPVMLGVVYILTHLPELTNYSIRSFSLDERLLTQLHVLVFYLKLILLPRLSEMSLFHDDFELVTHFDALTILLLAGLICSVILIFLLRRKAPVLAFAIAWFLASHVMESTFLNLELVFEHRNYLAALGPILVIMYYMVTKARLGRFPLVPVLVLTLLGFLTSVRVQEWSNAELIYSVAVKEHPESFRARTEYANILQISGRDGEAMEQLDRALELKANNFGPWLHKVAYLCGPNGGEEGEAQIASIMEQAKLKAGGFPVSAYALNALDVLTMKQNRGQCPHVSIDQLLAVTLAALEQKDNLKIGRYLGFLQRIAGRLYFLNRDLVHGVEYMQLAWENTRNPFVLSELASIQIQMGRYADAERYLAELEKVNVTSGGMEAHLVSEVKDKLSLARRDSGLDK